MRCEPAENCYVYFIIRNHVACHVTNDLKKIIHVQFSTVPASLPDNGNIFDVKEEARITPQHAPIINATASLTSRTVLWKNDIRLFMLLASKSL